jgi:3-keto-5-aminohexanoate cleavage enzyme
VALAPEMATLSMGSVNFGDDVFLNPPPDIEPFLHHAMRAHGVVPEFEVFDAGMLDTLARWVKKGVVAAPGHVDFVLGVPGGMSGTPEALMYLPIADGHAGHRARRSRARGLRGQHLAAPR